jgi:hypothetical protein
MPRNSINVALDLREYKNIPDRAAAAIRQELRTGVGPDALGESIRRAPVREGILRGSHSLHVDGQRVQTAADHGAGHPVATPAEGGEDTLGLNMAVVANTVYAMDQHENDYPHPKGGEKKWMERVLAENHDLYRREIGRAISRSLG